MHLHEVNTDFVIWLLQYFTPSAIVAMVVAVYSFKAMLVVYDIIKELKSRKPPPDE